jgi:translation initiation factor IF-2
MRSFSELGIENKCQPFSGEKIKMAKILNVPIIILAYKIEDTKYPKNRSNKCLHLQIELNGTKHVVFTGSDILINTIQQVQPEDMPFTTTIVKNGECYNFN